MGNGRFGEIKDKENGCVLLLFVLRLVVLLFFMFLFLNLLEKEGDGRRGDGDI